MKRLITYVLVLTVTPAIVALALLNPEKSETISGEQGTDTLCCVGWEDNLES